MFDDWLAFLAFSYFQRKV